MQNGDPIPTPIFVPNEVISQKAKVDHRGITELSPGQQYDFLFHDIKGGIIPRIQGFFASAYLKNASRDKNYPFGFDPVGDVIVDANQKEATMQKELTKKEAIPGQIVADVLPVVRLYQEEIGSRVDGLTTYFQNQETQKNGDLSLDVRRLVALKQMWPILKASVSYLQDPSDEHFNTLQALQINAQDLYLLTSNSDVNEELIKAVGATTDVNLTGTEAIIAYNLFSNAKKYRVDGVPFTASMSDERVMTVQNISSSPAPQFGMGMTGIGGNLGYGLYISSLLAKKIGREILRKQVKQPDGTYEIRHVVGTEAQLAKLN